MSQPKVVLVHGCWLDVVVVAGVIVVVVIGAVEAGVFYRAHRDEVDVGNAVHVLAARVEAWVWMCTSMLCDDGGDVWVDNAWLGEA